MPMFPVAVMEIFPVIFQSGLFHTAQKFLVVVQKQEECKTWQGDCFSKKEQVQSSDTEKLNRFL